jgi:hypothetical protein
VPSVVQREQGVERALPIQAFDPTQDRTASPVIDRSPERTKTDAPALTAAPALYAGAPLLRAVAINRISASDHADGELMRGLAPDATALTDHMDQAGQADHTRHSVPADLPSIPTPSKQPVQTSTDADPMPAIHARVERQLQLARVQAAEPVRSSLTTAAQLVSTPQPMNPHAESRVPNLLRVFATSVPWAARAADADRPAQTASSSPAGRGGTSGQSSVSHAATIDRLADQYGVVPVDTQQAGPSPGGTHRPAQNASAIAKTATSGAGNTIDASELAEQAWQIIQDKLAVERERRGFASWP